MYAGFHQLASFASPRGFLGDYQQRNLLFRIWELVSELSLR